MRHAKAAYPPGVLDRERPLAPRGVSDAKVASVWLRDHRDGIAPGPVLAIVSTAVRAQQTWDVAGRYLDGVDRRDEPRLYEASVSTAIGLAADADAQTVILVGHNPTAHDLVRMLAHAGDAGAWGLVSARFPTSTIAVLMLDEQADWALGSATLVAAVTPRARATRS